MIRLTDCKINIGLNVLRRRPDGYHDISTVMVHVPWHDIVEIVPARSGRTTLTVLGNSIDCPPEKNLVMKAWLALASQFDLPPVDIVLQKIVPDGAGLGGGSADAAYTLRLANEMFSLGCDNASLAAMAARLGADCAFFAYDTPMLAEGIGDVLTPVHIDLSAYTLLLVKPASVAISTPQAYAGITPAIPSTPLQQLIELPVEQWQGRIVNDFEQSIFPIAPQIAEVKEHLLRSGAVYASMSGSGSCVYGIFNSDKMAEEALRPYRHYPHLLTSGICH